MRFLAYFCTVLLITFVFSFHADAADFTNVANGVNTNITAHSVCRNVANATGATIFVPHKTSAEWSSVYNNPPSGVTINSCAVNGSCGSATSGAAVTAQPTTNLCSAGTFTELSDTSSWWRWRCDGTGGGSNSGTCQRARTSGGSCSPAVAVHRGVCSGSIVGQGGVNLGGVYQCRDACDASYTAASCAEEFLGPRGARRCFCYDGVVVDNNSADSGDYSVCVPGGGGVNGSCGSAASGAAVSSQPTTNLCSAGTFVELSDTSSWWQWRCNGTGGGSNSGTCQRARTSGGASCGTGSLFCGIYECNVGGAADGQTVAGSCLSSSGSCAGQCNNGSWSIDLCTCSGIPF